MGNAESEPLQPATEPSPPPTYSGFRKHVEHGWVIEKDAFIHKINPLLESLAERLWKKYSNLEFLSLTQYETLIYELNTRSDLANFFLSLLDSSELSLTDIQLSLSWFKWGESFKPDFEFAIFKPFFSSLVNESSFTIDLISNRLNTFFPNIADDLAHSVAHTLSHDEPLSLDFTVSSNFTMLLDRSLLWLLSILLDSPYKRPYETRLNNVAPLQIEQLGHLRCLYDSKAHGYSITKIKSLAFDYEGPLVILLKTDQYLFCLASDQGLKDSLKTYGTQDSILYRILPEFSKLVSGRSTRSAGPGADSGIIYSNFTAKTAKRGLFVGHQPLASPAIEINEGFTDLQFTGSAPMKLTAVEIWAAGSIAQLTRLQEHKEFELKLVNKEKNRKIKLHDDWRDSPDRLLLDMAGANVNHAACLGPENTESKTDK